MKKVFLNILQYSQENTCAKVSFSAAILFKRRHWKFSDSEFENLNSISNIFQETHNFLVLTDPVIICVYLKTTDKHFHDQENVCHPISKLLKCDLVQTLNTFRNLFFVTFCCREDISSFFYMDIVVCHKEYWEMIQNFRFYNSCFQFGYSNRVDENMIYRCCSFLSNVCRFVYD